MSKPGLAARVVALEAHVERLASMLGEMAVIYEGVITEITPVIVALVEGQVATAAAVEALAVEAEIELPAQPVPAAH